MFLFLLLKNSKLSDDTTSISCNNKRKIILDKRMGEDGSLACFIVEICSSIFLPRFQFAVQTLYALEK